MAFGMYSLLSHLEALTLLQSIGQIFVDSIDELQQYREAPLAKCYVKVAVMCNVPRWKWASAPVPHSHIETQPNYFRLPPSSFSSTCYDGCGYTIGRGGDYVDYARGHSLR